MSKPSRRQNVLDYDDLLLYWAQTMSDPALADDIGGRFDHVLVDEYQDTNRLQSSILLALKPGGRGLTVVGDDAQSIYSFRAATVRNILDFPSQFSPPADIITLDRNYRSTQADPRRRQRRDRSRARALHQEPLDRPDVGRQTPARHRARRGRPGALHRRTRAGEPRGRHAPEAAGGAVPHLQPQRPAGNRADPPQHSLRQVRRPQIPRCRPCQGHAGAVALRRESARPRRRLPADASDPGRRPDLGAAGARSHGRQRRSDRGACRGAGAAARRRRLEHVRRTRSRTSAIRTGRPTSNAPGSGTSRISTASTRMPRPAAPT